MDESRAEGPLERGADDGMIVAERVDADPRHEVEVPRPVFGDELGAIPSDKQGSDARVDVEQGRRGRQGRRARAKSGHAGWTAGARIRVPEIGRASCRERV